MIALVHVGDGEWSIAEVDEEDGLTWWCGRHEWVSPTSSYWAFNRACWNERFSTHGKALAFAKKRGWLA